VQDFGDGGAFPEIHLAQYPLNLGKPAEAKSKSNALAVQLDASGKVKYDLIARQGHGKVSQYIFFWGGVLIRYKSQLINALMTIMYT
jgi:hypothetical protein